MRRTPSKEEKRYLRGLFPHYPDAPCEDCGGWHWRACPRVKKQVWLGQGAGAGTRVEVEYWEHWDDSEVIWPEEVFDEESEDDNDSSPPGPVRSRIGGLPPDGDEREEDVRVSAPGGLHGEAGDGVDDPDMLGDGDD